MKAKYIFIAIVAALAAASCSDFLDIRMEATMPTTGMDYSKPDNIFLPVSAAYASMRLAEGEAQNYIAVLEVASDDADKGSSESDGPEVGEFDNFTYGPTNDHIGYVWSYFYNVVSAANHAYESMDKFKAAIKDEGALRQVEECRGEARVIRAWAYFNLVRMFGQIPLIDHTMDAGELATMKVSSVADIYKFLYSDLDAAIASLPDSYSDLQGRYTSYTARALKSKVALYNRDWREAAAQADTIIASGRFSLMPHFRDAFSVEHENGPESLMEIQSSDLGQVTGGMPICYYGFIQGPRNNPGTFQGWGYKVPSQSLVSFLTKRGDTIRKSVTLLERGKTTPEGDEISAKCPNRYYNGKVYVPSKYCTRSFNSYGLDHNMRLIRYADVLLIFAEAMAKGAAVRTKSGYTAESALNEVRARAGLKATEATLDNIYDERRAELALEENRFFDLVRWGRAASVLGPLGFTTGKNELFPIPADQRQLNPNLPQTPGYTY
ncbi:MAG: RagB/SusD family nutrient uptake outer membrane protein [Bacteroidales bacterium]|nr:RagB/SusD family nutrient uptake outer membrane protein [Bacteroidales bacterium]